MNKLFIIGNVTKDPELRTTPSGKNVCTFNVAVNRRKKVERQPEADFFRVSTWDTTAENCQKYLSKGKKVSIVGEVSLHVFSTQDGKPAATMEVNAKEVEFVSPKEQKEEPRTDAKSGMQVADPEDLPF